MARIPGQLRLGLREMPRGAVLTAAAGLVLSLLVFAGTQVQGESSKQIEWTTVEPVSVPAAAELPGGGSIRLARATLSAMPQTVRGYFLYRVAGSLTINSIGRPANLKCAVAGQTPSTIARTPKRRAAWPRPTAELRFDEVPELLVVRFSAKGSQVLGLPVRDSFDRFTDSAAPTKVRWDEYEDRKQTWAWEMPKGTGVGPASLAFGVVFKSTSRPRVTIDCRSDGVEISATATQKTWPVPQPA